MMSKKSPELRFKGFTDEWEQRKLSNESTITAGGDIDKSKLKEVGEYPIFANALTNDGTVGYYDSYYRVEAPAVTVTGRGDVGHAKARKVNFTPVVRLLAVKSNHDVDFLENAINNHKVLVESTGVPQLTAPQLGNYKIFFPTGEEQQKIGSFFKQLDDIIALYQRKLDLLKEQKKGFLQKMFPKNGAKVPELRFKGFTDDWEERKLGESSDVRDGTHASPKYVSQGHPMVTSKNLTHFGLDMTDVSFLTDKDFNEINKRSKVSIGDILFGMIGTIGNPVIVDRDDFAIKNVALIKEKTSNPITNKWLLQYLKSPSFNRFIQKENAGGTQKFISLGLIRDMKLRVPEFDEQQKIGAFFKQLDDTIALHQRKLDLLKEQKKGFLQKMFV
ncbi:restriction endonuclease subunit S [Streptococcus thermophilus]|uniref:restriction endonuclease subunit S n=1 Tax=Streptococcus thermophilus TaxID=1308 RepID=UPI001EF0CAFC|nr:restriction endonuclease subunit S [Streptococcus thermophilus]